MNTVYHRVLFHSVMCIALVNGAINDFGNIIYNIHEVESGLRVDLDIQYYYDPIIEDLRQCSAELFIKRAKKLLESDLYSWLSKYEETTK